MLRTTTISEERSEETAKSSHPARKPPTQPSSSQQQKSVPPSFSQQQRSIQPLSQQQRTSSQAIAPPSSQASRGKGIAVSNQGLFSQSSADATPTVHAKAMSAAPQSRHENIAVESSDGCREILRKLGVLLREARAGIVFDPARLRVGLKRVFHENPGMSDKFLRDFPSLLDEMTHAILRPSILSLHHSDIKPGPSLACILLQLTEIQPPLIDILVSKMHEHIMDENVHQSEGIARMILTQFRWMGHVVDQRLLLEKLVETLQIGPPEIQRDVISILPEVVTDARHEAIFDALRDLMRGNLDLTVPVLDAVTQLNLSASVMAEARTLAVDALASAREDDLPTVVRFLLQSADEKDLARIVRDIRHNLHFSSSSPLGSFMSSTQNSSRSKGKQSKSSISLTLDALRSGLQFRKDIAVAFLKEIQTLPAPEDHKIIDIWVLLILASMIHHHKAVESLLKKKVIANQLHPRLLATAFSGFTENLEEYFRTILKLAEFFIQSADQSIRRFGIKFYKTIFIHFSRSDQRQEILGALLAHIGSGQSGEVDAALDTIILLCQDDTGALSGYVSLLKGLIHQAILMKEPDARKLYHLFSLLLRVDLDGSLRNDLSIQIQKNICHPSLKYKRLGIIAACCALETMSTPFQGSGRGMEAPPDAQLKEAEELIHKMFNYCQRSLFGKMFLQDELAHLVQRAPVDMQILKVIKGYVIEVVEDVYLTDVGLEERVRSDYVDLKVETWMNLDGKGAALALNALPLLASRESHKRDWASLMGSTLRLLAEATFREEKSLEAIDAVLGCPFSLFSKEYAQENLDTCSLNERELICKAVFHVINWIRELINTFSRWVEGADIAAKLLLRFENMIQLEQLLDRLLELSPDVHLLELVTSPELRAIMVDTAGVKRLMGRKPTPIKKAAESDKEKDKEDGVEKEQKTQTKEAKEKVLQNGVPALKSLSTVQKLFRELEVSTSVILTFTKPIVSSVQVEDDCGTLKTRHTLQIQTVYYLLEDIMTKVNTVLPKKKGPFGSADSSSITSVASRMGPVAFLRQLMPALSKFNEHLERIVSLFPTLALAHEPDASSVYIVPTFILLCKVIERVHSLVNTLSEEKASFSKELLLTFVPHLPRDGGMADDQASQLPVARLAEEAFSYFEAFGSSLPTFSCAQALCDLLHELIHDLPKGSTHARLSALGSKFLQKPWGQEKIKADGLVSMLKLNVRNAKIPLYVIKELGTNVIPSFSANPESTAETHPLLTKGSLIYYYRTAMEELAESAITLNDSADPEIQNVEEYLECLNEHALLFQALIVMTKTHDQRPFLLVALKAGKPIIESFTKSIGLISGYFRDNHRKILDVLKSTQASTRIIQAICAHGKVIRDVQMTTYIPSMKKVLESLIFKVKFVLKTNNCLGAFWLGNLKHRDVSGVEVQSQVPGSSSEGEEEEDIEIGVRGASRVQNQARRTAEEQDEEEEVRSDAESAEENRPGSDSDMEILEAEVVINGSDPESGDEQEVSKKKQKDVQPPQKTSTQRQPKKRIVMSDDEQPGDGNDEERPETPAKGTSAKDAPKRRKKKDDVAAAVERDEPETNAERVDSVAAVGPKAKKGRALAAEKKGVDGSSAAKTTASTVSSATAVTPGKQVGLGARKRQTSPASPTGQSLKSPPASSPMYLPPPPLPLGSASTSGAVNGGLLATSTDAASQRPRPVKSLGAKPRPTKKQALGNDE
eukprot:TRINITY_DN250_c0_g1_i9.p1 TRINITY_DN250_c0_g1~~TRINITY_DN250_c0_g1_i9.p1  ORF type:complete len:1709 (-),score=385.21 TRINITY_DN250_c0_g1_i9:107-5233(-)